MKTTSVFYILIGCMLTTFSLEAYGKRISCCVDSSRAKDGEQGVPGYFEDGEDGENGKNGQNGQSGGHGGNGGASIYGNGGNGGNGGDAD